MQAVRRVGGAERGRFADQHVRVHGHAVKDQRFRRQPPAGRLLRKPRVRAGARAHDRRRTLPGALVDRGFRHHKSLLPRAKYQVPALRQQQHGNAHFAATPPFQPHRKRLGRDFAIIGIAKRFPCKQLPERLLRRLLKAARPAQRAAHQLARDLIELRRRALIERRAVQHAVHAGHGNRRRVRRRAVARTHLIAQVRVPQRPTEGPHVAAHRRNAAEQRQHHHQQRQDDKRKIPHCIFE